MDLNAFNAEKIEKRENIPFCSLLKLAKDMMIEYSVHHNYVTITIMSTMSSDRNKERVCLREKGECKVVNESMEYR